jgi:hypothetical protein
MKSMRMEWSAKALQRMLDNESDITHIKTKIELKQKEVVNMEKIFE